MGADPPVIDGQNSDLAIVCAQGNDDIPAITIAPREAMTFPNNVRYTPGRLFGRDPSSVSFKRDKRCFQVLVVTLVGASATGLAPRLFRGFR